MRILILSIILFCMIPVNGQISKELANIEDEVFTVWESGDLEKTSKLLHDFRNDNSEFFYELSEYIMELAIQQEDYNGFLTTWKEGIEKGYFFHPHLHGPEARAITEKKEYSEIVELNENTMIAEGKTCGVRVDLVFPEDYDKEMNYPLLLVLHGYGRNNHKMSRWFKSTEISKSFILGFIQSSVRIGTRSYVWEIGDQCLQDIDEGIRQIGEMCQFNRQQIIISGMSQGGTAALYYSAHAINKIAGVIVNCADIAQIEKEEINLLLGKEIPIVFYTGELDHNIKLQKNFIEKFQGLNTNFIYEIFTGVGHRYPDNFSEKIDFGLNFISEISQADKR